MREVRNGVYEQEARVELDVRRKNNGSPLHETMPCPIESKGKKLFDLPQTKGVPVKILAFVWGNQKP